MDVKHRLGAGITALILLAVPAMTFVLFASDMAEPVAREQAAVAAAVHNQTASAEVRDNHSARSSPIVTLTEWTFTCASPCSPLGDVNFDGAVNGLDVAPFVKWVVDGTAGQDWLLWCPADINRDGAVNGLDVRGFVCLVLCGCPCP